MASVAASRQLTSSPRYDSSRPHHPPTLTMVLEAVQALDKPKGVSAFAIKHYILHQYPGIDPVRLKYYLKQALVKAVNQGQLVRPSKSSAQGAAGSFKLGKNKAQKGKDLKMKSSDEEPAAKVEREAMKQPKVKEKSPKQKLKTKGAEQVKKKTASTKPETALGDGGAIASGAKPKAKASGEKASKATKQQGAPTTSQAKLVSGPKKGAPKAKAELKSVPGTEVKSKPPQEEKAKGDALPKTAIARSRAASEAKAARAKGKPKAKKGAVKGQEKGEATAGSEA